MNDCFYILFLSAVIVKSAPLPFLTKIPSLRISLIFIKEWTLAREDHFHTAQRQTRAYLHVFARYTRGIYPQRGKSCIRCHISGNQPGTAASKIGPGKFLEQNCDTRQQHTFSFKCNISLSIYTYVLYIYILFSLIANVNIATVNKIDLF